MNNLSTVAIGVIIVVALLLLVLASKGKKGTGHTEKPYANKTPVSKNEQAMYWQLCKALPEYLVMCQVSFGALLRAKSTSTRNRFQRKIADFVVFDQAFKVIAVIELDDKSHQGREQEDKNREQLLTHAGLRVLRYKRVPNVDELRAQVQGQQNPPARGSATS